MGLSTVMVVVTLLACLTVYKFTFARSGRVCKVADRSNVAGNLSLGNKDIVIFATRGRDPSTRRVSAITTLLRAHLSNVNCARTSMSIRNRGDIEIRVPSFSGPRTTTRDLKTATRLGFCSGDNVSRAARRFVRNGRILDNGRVGNTATRCNTADRVNSTNCCIRLRLASRNRGTFCRTASGGMKRPVCVIVSDVPVSTPAIRATVGSAAYVVSNSFARRRTDGLTTGVGSNRLPFDLDISRVETIGTALNTGTLGGTMGTNVIKLVLIVLFLVVLCELPKFVSSVTLVTCISIILLVITGFRVGLALTNVTNVVLTVNVTISTGMVVFRHIGRRLLGNGNIGASIRTNFRETLDTIVSSGVAAVVSTIVL